MQLPPNLQVAAFTTQATNAVANTSSTLTLVAAPGAGLRIRVWMVSLSLVQNSPAGKLRGLFQTGAGVANLVLLGVSTTEAPYNDASPPGGIVAGTNAIVRLQNFGSAASLTYDVAVHYTIEAV